MVHSRFSLDDPERPIICESKSELVGYHFYVKFTVYIFIFDFRKPHNGFDQDYREQKMENFVGFVIIQRQWVKIVVSITKQFRFVSKLLGFTIVGLISQFLKKILGFYKKNFLQLWS